jgi:hypothetical protein
MTGLMLGLVFLTKAEVFLAAAAAVFVGAAAITLLRRRGFDLLMLLSGAVLAPITALLMLTGAGLSASQAMRGIAGSWPWLGNRQLLGLPYFRDLAGTSDLAGSLARSGLVAVCWLVLFGAPALVAKFASKSHAAGVALGILLFGLLTWLLSGDRWFEMVRPLPLLATVIAALFIMRIWRERTTKFIVPLAFAIFAGVMTVKMVLNVRIVHYGFALAMPGTMLLVVAIVAWLPQCSTSGREASRVWFIRASVFGVIAAALLGHLRIMSFWFSQKTVPVARNTSDYFLADSRGASVEALSQRIEQFTPREATLVCMPEGSLTNFLTRRVNPTGHLQFTPAALIMFNEQRVLADLQRRPPDYIAVFNHPTPEYGAAFFGKDYAVEIGRWIRANYEPEVIFNAPLSRPEQFGVTLLRRLRTAEPAPR